MQNRNLKIPKREILVPVELGDGNRVQCILVSYPVTLTVLLTPLVPKMGLVT